MNIVYLSIFFLDFKSSHQCFVLSTYLHLSPIIRVFYVFVNGIFKSSCSIYLLPGYGNMVDFLILILPTAVLLGSLTSASNCFVGALGFFPIDEHVMCE